MDHRKNSCRFTLGLPFVLAMGVSSSYAIAPLNVTIEGGTDGAGHEYRWTLTNDHTSPIHYVAFPQSNGDLCLPPKGWSAELTVDECVFRAPSTAEMITPGRSAEFAMRISPKGARRGKGHVVIEFADGVRTRVAGVQIAEAETVGDRFVPLIGMGVVLLVVVLTQTRSRRKRGGAAATGS